MPPTYSPWLNPFEKLARFGLLGRRRMLGALATGVPGSVDCRLSEDWRAYASSRALFELWGPPQTSPWSGYHRPTLFAALDSIGENMRWPAAVPPLLPGDAPHERAPWAARDAALLLDLPGPHAVAWAAWLARRWHEPVVTFNNWPHGNALVDMGMALGALLHFAPWAREGKDAREKDAPPVFILDRRRLGPRAPRPRDFDNRYYLLESDLPSVATLQKHGVTHLVYARPGDLAPGAPEEMDDMNRYLHEVAKKMPVKVVPLSTTSWTWGEARDHAPAIRPTPFNTVKDPAFADFRRAAAGGFGELVPEPSSGGG